MIGIFRQGWQTLMAQTPDFTALGRKFRGEDARLGWDDLAIGVGIVAGLALLILLLKRLSPTSLTHRAYHRPGQLFGELCRAHGLGQAECRLLRRLAQSQGLNQPAQLFVQPWRFDPQSLPPAMGRFEVQLAKLHDRLFG